MAEYLATATQEVAQNGNVIFTNTAVQGGNCIKHCGRNFISNCNCRGTGPFLTDAFYARRRVTVQQRIRRDLHRRSG